VPTQAAEAIDVVKRPAREIDVQPRIIYGARVTRRMVALTFDLDMSPWMVAEQRAGRVKPWVNQEALALLQQSGIHATLFMTGMWAEVNPELARRLATSPQFEIGNHTYAHAAYHLPCYRLAGLSRAGISADLDASQATIERITGVRPAYFRFPGGCYDSAALNAVHVAGLVPVQWTLNSGDAFNLYAEQIAWTVVHGVRPGAIVMMHLHGGPNAPASGAALRIIIPALKQMGYEFVTVSELLAAGSVIGPTDPREVVEALPPPEPRAFPQSRWCSFTRASKTVWVRC
jgi:peptidoglycan/xylan/chitin deacetylase (PgdA/CDA1 family)